MKQEFEYLDKLDKAVIIAIAILIFLLFSQHSEAAEKPQYNFNAAGEPSYSNEKTGMNFKAAKESDDQVQADPVNMIHNDQPFTGYVGYPRFQVSVDYAPTSTGFKQEYNNLPLNFSAASYGSADITGRFLVNPQVTAELEYSHSAFSVQAKDLGSYQVLQSTANIDTLMGRVTYCQVLTHANNKFCYGGVAGLDAYPSMQFTTATDMSIASIRDLVLGLNLGYQHELGPYTYLSSVIEYLYGLRQGQDSNLGVDSDSKARARIEFNFSNRNNLNYYSAGAEYSYREAQVHGTTGSFTDTWSTKASSFALMMKYTWTWDRGL